tara:strand:+ start:142 stop:729 length:588 start_codon:yes stop_codon:yes gene_type:complete
MKYDNGKIYKLIDNTNGNIYIGSTIQPLYKRKSQHKVQGNNKCRSKFIIDNGDYDIILIEKYPCESKEELEARERYYIKSIDCINKNIPGRSSVEWYQDNKERILEKSKNKIKTDERKEYEKEYALKNKDIINEKSKLWYQDNKDKKREYDEQYRKDKKEEKQKYFREHSIYKKTWGGDPRNDNNLLKIDINLFI